MLVSRRNVGLVRILENIEREREMRMEDRREEYNDREEETGNQRSSEER